jgi:hypothetical protein
MGTILESRHCSHDTSGVGTVHAVWGAIDELCEYTDETE